MISLLVTVVIFKPFWSLRAHQIPRAIQLHTVLLRAEWIGMEERR